MGLSNGRVWWTAAGKRRIVELTLQPGMSVALVAQAEGVNSHQVFQWRRAESDTLGSYKHGVTCPWQCSEISFGGGGYQEGKPCEMESKVNHRALYQRAYALKKHRARASITTSDWNGTECY
jgi:hypothetical protein